MFKSIGKLQNPINIEVGNGRKISSDSTGDALVKLILPDGSHKKCIISNVLHVPELAYNLLSVSQIESVGKHVIFQDDKCKISDSNERVTATGTKFNKLYRLTCVHVKSNEIACVV